MDSLPPRFVAYAGGVLRRMAAVMAAGLVAGFLAGGVGGRLMMRLLAVTSDPATHGMITDDEAVVGEMTLGGTLSFVIFVSLGLSVLALGYLALRRYLPGTGWRQGAAFGLLVAGAFAYFELHSGERDMTVLGPQPLPVLLTFVAIPLVYGILVGVLADRFNRFYERIRLRSPQAAAFAVLAPLFLAGPFFVVIGVALVLHWALTVKAPWGRRWAQPGVARVGGTALVALMVVLAGVGATRAADIESRPVARADFVAH